MSEQSLGIPFNYGLADSFIAPWLRLEQEGLADIAEMATIEDVVSMLNMIKAGFSAKTDPNTDCALFVDEDGTAHFMTRIFVFLNPIDMDYNIKISEGNNYSELGPREIITDLNKQESIIFNHTDSVTVDWDIEEFSYYWETPTYNKSANVVSKPSVSADGKTITLSKSVFGIMRIVSTTVLHAYDVVISKDEGFKIEDFACTVEAEYTYNDEEGTSKTEVQTLAIKVPECVEGALAECENGKGLIVRLMHLNNDNCQTIKYYNVCTGSIIGHKHDCPDPQQTGEWDFGGLDDPQYGVWRQRFSDWIKKKRN